MFFQVFFVVTMCALVAIGAVAALRRRRALVAGERAGTPFELQRTSSMPPAPELGIGDLPTASEPKSSASVPPSSSDMPELRMVRAPSRSPREDLQALMADRCSRGQCMVCGAPASKPSPRTRVVSDNLSWVARQFGAIPKIITIIEPEPKTPHCLCASHHEVGLRHLEEGIAQMQFDQTRFLSEQREQWLTFQRYGMFERMLSEESKRLREGAPVARRRGKTKLVPLASTGSGDA